MTLHTQEQTTLTGFHAATKHETCHETELTRFANGDFDQDIQQHNVWLHQLQVCTPCQHFYQEHLMDTDLADHIEATRIKAPALTHFIQSPESDNHRYVFVSVDGIYAFSLLLSLEHKTAWLEPPTAGSGKRVIPSLEIEGRRLTPDEHGEHIFQPDEAALVRGILRYFAIPLAWEPVLPAQPRQPEMGFLTRMRTIWLPLVMVNAAVLGAVVLFSAQHIIPTTPSPPVALTDEQYRHLLSGPNVTISPTRLQQLEGEGPEKWLEIIGERFIDGENAEGEQLYRVFKARFPTFGDD